MKKMKRNCLYIALLLIAVIIISAIIWRMNSGNQTVAFKSQYFSLSLPQDWAYQDNGYSVSLYCQDKKIAIISMEEDFEYRDSVEKIVANWIGMRTSIQSSTLFMTDHGYEFYKVIVETELSAAQEIAEEEQEPDEIHYFYVSEENLFIDVYVLDDAYLVEIENVLLSFSE